MTAEARRCEACGSTSTYIYNGSSKWHRAGDKWVCHNCYSAGAAVDVISRHSDHGGELLARKEAIELLEMKCANQSCENMIYIKGAPAMSIDDIKAFCSDCSITSTYKKASMKSTYVKRIVDGQLRLDTSLEKSADD